MTTFFKMIEGKITKRRCVSGKRAFYMAKEAPDGWPYKN
jgi:hypothetical protein